MPQHNLLVKVDGKETTRQDHMLLQQQRVREGNGIHILEEHGLNRRERRKWASAMTQKARRRAKRRLQRHSVLHTKRVSPLPPVTQKQRS